MNCGEFLLAHSPFTDQTGAKLRPVLVVSSDSHNHGSDLVVVPVSSRPSPSDRFSYHLDISLQQFQSAGLKRSSSIKWNKPLTIDKSVVVG
jgi:mRNA-degrading endonuclease toxin of MazEF toxin-antitoxin module